MTARFNPSGSVSFDLARGRVSCGGEQVLVSPDALADLCGAAGEEASVDFGRRLGTALGRRAAERLGGSTTYATMEEAVDFLGGELALLGLGSLAAERWGRALVLTVTGAPFGPAQDGLLGAILEGALQRAFGKDAVAVKLQRDDARVRYLIAGRAASEKVRSWLASGVLWSEALTRIQSKAGST